MRPDKIVIRGAREHNLKNVTVEIPRDQLVVLTGVSGSGKSSLAFDTLYAEGQRRYVESLSSYARQFLGTQQKPAVDYIAGLSPAISIEQKTASKNPRSTVGTVTEIHDYLRVLYARVGEPHCPSCGRKVGKQAAEQIVDQILAQEPGSQWLVLAPVARNRKGEYQDVFARAKKDGFARVRVNGQVRSLDETITLDKKRKHLVDIVVDRIQIPGQSESPESRVQSPELAAPRAEAEVGQGVDRARLTDSVETALRFGDGMVVLAPYGPSPQSRVQSPESPRPAKRGRAGNPRSGWRGEGLADTGLAPASGGGLKGMAASANDLLFSERNACLYCGLSFDDLSPQMFSFNSPIGACPACLGLGSSLEVDPDLVVPDKTKSLREGAIVPWGEQDQTDADTWGEHYRAQVLTHYGIPADVPYGELSEEHKKLLLYGGDGERVKITWQAKNGRSSGSWYSKWEGAIPRLKRRLKQTDSEESREEYLQFFTQQRCDACQGEKLKPEARAVLVDGRSLVAVERLSIADALTFFQTVQLPEREQIIAQELLKEIRGRLEFLMNVGLHYLTLDRSAPTLSGGEAQRIRLASQIGCGLVGVLYILDEPSIGLHQRDNGKLIHTLESLRDIGNTVVVVEHDLETMLAADYLIDFGPGAGIDGGHVVAAGTPSEVAQQPASLTGRFLSGELSIPIPAHRRPGAEKWLTIHGAREHNLKDVTVRVPLERLVVVTGVSGSGKSSLVNEILYKSLERDLMRASVRPGIYERIEGTAHLDKVIAIDQDPIGRTPRSNPATYVGVYDAIRQLFAQVPEARIRGYKPGRFSFNVKGGRCEACQGDGLKRIEMQFLADVFVPCEVCKGKRFNRETLEVRFKEKSIADVLEMTIDEAAQLFANVPAVARVLNTLIDVGLGYMHLGQPAPTLSGGEAQRVKLARELCRPATGKTLYVLDEPTTGLHFADIQKLLDVLHRLVKNGNSVVVIEHNLDVIKTADWLIDLGPEGGEGGGEVLAEGTPEQVAHSAISFTGHFLRGILGITLPETGAPWANGKAHPQRTQTLDGALGVTPASLKLLRLQLGLSQAEAAQAIGISRGLLAEAERGRRAGERTLTRIGLGLGELASRTARPA